MTGAHASVTTPLLYSLTTALLLIIASPLTTINGAETAAHYSLFLAIDERLSHMQAVALYKVQNQIPIEDIEREEIVLEDAKALAAKHGLEPDSMERFFRAQINAAKAIQYRFKTENLEQHSSLSSVDLQSDIRPALDRLSIEIVTRFAALLQAGDVITANNRELFLSTLQRPLLPLVDQEILFDTMLEVKHSR